MHRLREAGWRVIFVYLCEAHAADTWPLSPEAPCQHKTLQERLTAARALLSSHPDFASAVDEWFVDTLENTTTVANGFWPEKYVVAREGVVEWASDLTSEVPGPECEVLSGLVQG